MLHSPPCLQVCEVFSVYRPRINPELYRTIVDFLTHCRRALTSLDGAHRVLTVYQHLLNLVIGFHHRPGLNMMYMVTSIIIEFSRSSNRDLPHIPHLPFPTNKKNFSTKGALSTIFFMQSYVVDVAAPPLASCSHQQHSFA